MTAAGRHVLDEHDARGEGQLGRLRAGHHPRQHQEHHGQQPDAADLHDDRAVEPLLVHLQRVLADHPDARGLGRHRHRCRPGSGGCSSAAYGTADAACDAVYTYLSKQAGYDPANPKAANNSLSTYATNPLWQIVDGPWKLTAFDASGNVTMVPNPALLGTRQADDREVQGAALHHRLAEFNALVAGNIDFGYLPDPGRHRRRPRARSCRGRTTRG